MNDLVRELQALRADRGGPSLRDLSEKTGINRQSLSEAFTGKRFPSWSTVEKIVLALNGDMPQFRVAWDYSKTGFHAAGNDFSTTEQEPMSCFLSYSHSDDTHMSFSTALKAGLEYYALANRGRQLTVFLDKDDLKWGDDWQVSIRQRVRGATVFMPVVTYSYFQSPFCREELLLYYQNARSAGVTELILPIVVFGQSALSTNSDDEVARIIAERQYKDLQDAFLEGPGSNTWRRAMLDVADSLVDVVDSAEKKLAPSLTGDPAAADTDEIEHESDDDDSLGLSELSEQAEALAGGLTGLATKYVAEMNHVLDVVKAGFGKPSDSKWSSRELTLLAAKVAPLANQAAETGKKLESQAAEADSVLREALDLMKLGGFDEARNSLIDDFAKAGGSNDFNEIETTVEQMSKSLLTAEVLSVALRKALRPLRNSLRSVKSAAKIFDSWARLKES